jgi:hypothetical protein
MSAVVKPFSYFPFEASFSPSNDYRLQRHRRESLQDVVLMTFVIWNSCVSFRSKKKGEGGGEFSLFVRELFAFCRFSVVYLFGNEKFSVLNLLQRERARDDGGGGFGKYWKKLLRSSSKTREALSISFFHFTLFVFRQI